MHANMTLGEALDVDPQHAELLIRLAEKYEGDSRRPCCDADTTLHDWIEAGLYVLQEEEEVR